MRNEDALFFVIFYLRDIIASYRRAEKSVCGYYRSGEYILNIFLL